MRKVINWGNSHIKVKSLVQNTIIQTYRTLVRFITSVNPHMCFKLLSGEKTFTALLALMIAHKQMLSFLVVYQSGSRTKTLTTLTTQMWFVPGMNYLMDSPLLISCKSLVTQFTLIWLYAYNINTWNGIHCIEAPKIDGTAKCYSFLHYHPGNKSFLYIEH